MVLLKTHVQKSFPIVFPSLPLSQQGKGCFQMTFFLSKSPIKVILLNNAHTTNYSPRHAYLCTQSQTWYLAKKICDVCIISGGEKKIWIVATPNYYATKQNIIIMD